jgi:putative ABC transport system ATP-binding protein
VVVRGVSHWLGEGELRKQILFDISVDVEPGEIVMIMGPSGSGKTTLLNLVGTTRSVTEGSLQVLGCELAGAPPAAITRMRRRLGFIFQHHHLLDALTACQNVQMGLRNLGVPPKVSLERSLAMLAAVGLRDHSHAYPGQLSGGQCQRVAVARALVREPELILADEPTAALDKQTGREIVELLRRLARERTSTVVIVTHDPRILDVADRLMYLEDGRLSSFATVTSAHAVHLLTSLRPIVDSGQLSPFLERMEPADFVDLMRTVAAEAEQFLHVFQFGSREELRQVFHTLMQAALERVREQMNVRATRLWVRTGSGLACVGGTAPAPGGCPPLAAAALSATECRGENGTVFLPLQNRDAEFHAVLEIEGAPAAAAVERAVRDFTRPFGLLAQISAVGQKASTA